LCFNETMASDPRDPFIMNLFVLKPRKGDIRRLKIIEAAIEVMATHSVDAVSFENVGKKLGIHRAHVAYYFSKKEEMVDEAIRFITATAQKTTIDLITKALSSEDKIRAYIEASFTWAENYPSHAKAMISFYQICLSRKKFRAMHQKMRQAGHQRVIALIQESVSFSHLKISEAREMATTIQSLITSRLLEHLTTENAQSLEEVKNQTLATVTLLMANAVKPTA